MNKKKLKTLLTASVLAAVLVFQETAAFGAQSYENISSENEISADDSVAVTADNGEESESQEASNDNGEVTEPWEAASENGEETAIVDENSDEVIRDPSEDADDQDSSTADDDAEEDSNTADGDAEEDSSSADSDAEEDSSTVKDDMEEDSTDLAEAEAQAQNAETFAAPQMTMKVNSSFSSVTITLKNITDTSAVYKFAIWSEENGQDDLYWAAGEINGTTVTNKTALSNFKHTGVFDVHCYKYYSDDSSEFVCGGQFTLETPEAECSFSDLNSNGKFTFHLDSVYVPAGISKVRVAVWRKSDKSDLVWYTWNGSDITCDLYSFNNSFGKYKACVYITDKNGMETAAGKCTRTFSNTVTFAHSVKMTMSSKTTSTFTITVKGLNASNGIKSLKAAVWSKSDQSNLCWYKSFTDKGNGTYVLSGNLSKHGYQMGTYYIHIYLTDNSGKESFLIGTTRTLTAACSGIKTAYNDTTTNACFKLFGLKSYGMYKYVKYAVWSSDDQKDLKWLTSKNGGNFKLTYKMSNFGKNGVYNVHCYGYKQDGTSVYLGGTTFTVSGIVTPTTVKLSRISDEKVKIKIYNANYKGYEPDNVRIGVWSSATGVGNSGAQDDLVWYRAKKSSDGSYYYATIDRAKHLSSGLYYLHVYADRGGESAFCVGTSCRLYKTEEFEGIYEEVAVNSILACETGGQVYGNCRYDEFTEAYHISPLETGITIGCGSWMGSKAVQLLLDIRAADPALFASLDTAGISADLDSLADTPSLWMYYGGRSDVGGVIKKGSAKALAIQAVISSSVGIAVQKSEFADEVEAYVDAAASAGVKDIEAQILMAETALLGGTGAMNRIITKASGLGYDMTVEDLWSVMLMDQSDTSNNNQVGDKLYESRHLKIIGWIYQYLE